MKPFRTLAQTRTPDGSQLSLLEHDGDFFLKLNGRQLMSTTATASEILLAQLACNFLVCYPAPRILIGGLGLGFTLKRVLSIVGPKAMVHVAEHLAEVVAWNREFMGDANKSALDDGRVSVFVADVMNVIKRSDRGQDRYDAILMDVDNGPVATVKGNERIYSSRGLAAIFRALNPGGRVAFWSASEDRPFFDRLLATGFTVKVFEAKAHEKAKRAAHRIYVGEKN